jgi:hypothetical protein
VEHPRGSDAPRTQDWWLDLGILVGGLRSIDRADVEDLLVRAVEGGCTSGEILAGRLDRLEHADHAPAHDSVRRQRTMHFLRLRPATAALSCSAAGDLCRARRFANVVGPRTSSLHVSEGSGPPED